MVKLRKVAASWADVGQDSCSDAGAWLPTCAPHTLPMPTPRGRSSGWERAHGALTRGRGMGTMQASTVPSGGHSREDPVVGSDPLAGTREPLPGAWVPGHVAQGQRVSDRLFETGTGFLQLR